MIRAPLTIAPLNKLMDNYHIYKILIFTPNNIDYYTKIATNVKAIIYYCNLNYYLTITGEAYLPTKDTLDLKNLPLLLHSCSKMACRLALLEKDLEALKTFCRYYVVKRKILTGVVKITNDNFFV